MRIGIDCRPLSRPPAGVSRVLTNIIRELQLIDNENLYYLYSDREFDLPFHSERWRKRIHSRFRFLPGTFWLQTDARSMSLQDRVDVFWGTAQILPLGLPAKVGKVLTVHDLVWQLYPETTTWFGRYAHRRYAERSIREADRVISDSESTARDLQRILNVPESKIEVVHLGVGPAYKPHDPSAAAEYVASKYGVSKDYGLTVGTVEPRKNLVTLVEAMKILRDRGEHSLQLLVAGGTGWKNAKIYNSVQRSGLTESDIRFVGFVPEENLPVLYSGASIFLFPSLYEGFGLPLVEAMACGAPVVASNIAVTAEVVQDAALLVPPLEAEGFAEAMQYVRRDSSLRAAMIQKGFERARHFRWDEAAKQMLQIFGEISKRSC